MAIEVKRESLDTKSIHVSPSYVDKDGVQYLIGSDRPSPIIEINHLRLHEGKAYYAYILKPDSAKLPQNQHIDIAIAWATGVTPHLVYQANCGGDSEIYMYENAVVTGGTGFTALQKNRTIATSSSSAIIINPTITSLGTQLEAQFIGGGASNNSGGSISYVSEFVLSPLTTYLFRLTNVTGQSHMAHLQLEWYE